MEQNDSKKNENKFLSYAKNHNYITGGFLFLVIVGVGAGWFFSDKKTATSMKVVPAIETAATSGVVSAAYSACINETKDNPQCKDCCDCLNDSDSATITACRNTCATHDFATNTNFITVSVPSTLGEKGDYSTCTNETSSGECKTCCESSLGLQCGDYRFCRTACNVKFGTPSGPPK